MAEGYLPEPLKDVSSLGEEALLYCKTNIGGYFFDGFLNVNLSRNTEITQNPVETGASVVDHAYIKPVEISMDVKMSDVNKSLIPEQFDGSYSRSVRAFDILKEIQENRVPVSVLCRLGLYKNMLIQSITAEDNVDTYRALNAKVTLVELPIARVKTVKISAASQTTLTTEMGKLNAVETNVEDMSMLYRLNAATGLNL